MSTANFVADTHQGRVIVTREGPTGELFRVEMAPSEVEKATKVVGLALSMVGLPNVPDHINNTPFVVRFFPSRVFALERKDAGDSMPFRLHEGDVLITTLQMALGMCLNEQTQGRVVPVGTAVIPGLVGSEPL